MATSRHRKLSAAALGQQFQGVAGILRHSSRGAAFLTVLLLSIAIYAPLPFAGALPRDHFLLDLLAFAAALWALGPLGLFGAARAAWKPAAALALLALWALVQSLTWPAPLLRLLSPGAAELWTVGHELVRLSEAAEQPPSAAAAPAKAAEPPFWLGSPSLAPSASRAAALHWLALAALLLAATAASQERAARRLLALALLGGAFFQVFYGAGGWLAKSGTIWGVAVRGEPGRLRGTFVNSDHFALYLSFATLLAAGWLWWAGRKIWRERAWDRAVLLGGAPLLAFFSCFVAVAFSGSRAGLLALILALAAQGLALALHYGRWQVFLGSAAAIGVGLLGVLLVGWQQGFGRLLSTSLYEVTWNARLEVYAATLRLAGQFPALGTGLGSFRSAFPLVQPPTLTASWEHAHNDYLELLATGGPVALVLAGFGVWALGRGLWSALHLGRRSEDRATGLVAWGAVAAAGAHAFFDFGLTMPANAFTLTLLAGIALGVGQGHAGPKKASGLTVFLPEDASSKPIAGQGL